MVTERRFRTSNAAFLGLLLVASYAGCFPDLDALSEGGGEAGSESGGTGGTSTGASGGTAGSEAGSAGSSATGGSEGGTAGTGNPEGGAGGAAGGGGEAGEMGGAGTGAVGGACSTDLDVGKPEGDTVTDCGSCGLTCSLRNASRSICAEGTCEPTCSDGYDDCNAGMANDGCETAITTAANCGACGAQCNLTNVSTANCVAGACAPSCADGYADCNASSTNDGCETDANTVTNCGACGYACSTEHVVSTACNMGRCAPTCGPGWGDCNASAMLTVDDGCEVYLDSLTACSPACGGTPVDCEPTEVCNSGACGAPQGVAVWTVPLTATAQVQRYAEIFPGFPDLTNVVITVRLYAPGATGGNLLGYFTDSDFTAGGGGTVPLASLADGWVDVAFPVGGPNASYDPTSIRQISLEVTTEGSPGPFTNPTIVYVDGVRSSNLLITDTFDTTLGNMVISTTRFIDGATLTWSDAVP